MAVIKIVPMPGAEGQKGDTGATGPQGPQGATGAQGPAGADALWHYNGPWQSNATYAEGDVVTHDGQTYYATGVTTLGTVPASDSNFDLIAAKGSDVSLTNVVFGSGSWDSRFYEENGIVPNLSGSLAPGFTPEFPRYQTQYPIKTNYYTIGDMVFWHLQAFVIDATQWGELTTNEVSGIQFYRQWRFYLPFKHDIDFYDWTIDGSVSGGTPVPFIGRAVIRNDYEPNIADEEHFVMPIYGALVLDEENNESYVALSYLKDDEEEHTSHDHFHPLTAQDPTDLVYEGPGSVLGRKYVRITMSGSYKREI